MYKPEESERNQTEKNEANLGPSSVYLALKKEADSSLEAALAMKATQQE